MSVYARFEFIVETADVNAVTIEDEDVIDDAAEAARKAFEAKLPKKFEVAIKGG
jgi:hypothetical protein